MSKIKTITLGCRFNFYESEVSKAMIKGLEPDSDVVVINTCSVTHEAERQSKQAVRKAIRENSGAKIIVTGCAAKTSAEYFENLEGVFKVIQNDDKDNIHSYTSVSQNASKINFDDSAIDEEGDPLFKNKARVFMQIQNGCDHFCTYCIVPFTRGRSKSLSLEAILKRVEYFSDHGFKEIVLSGIDITSYGKDLENNIEFADVLESILKNFPDQKRIRISSIDPKGVNERLFDILATEKRIMPHFHLSIQSGDNDVLKAMRRRHSREDVINFCNKLHDIRPDIVFGSDFIAGFPTETQAMFENTLKIIDEANLSLMHVFPYSPRSGTVASNMIQLPKNVILERAKILREKAQDAKLKLLKNMVGKKVSGIVEKYADGISFGKTDSFIPFSINLSSQPSDILQDLTVVGYDEEKIILEKK